MVPSSPGLGARIFDVAIRAGVVLVAGAIVLNAVRSIIRGDPAERTPVWDPRKLAAPPLALTAVDGTHLDLAAERGRAVLIVSFAARETNRRWLVDLAERARAAAEASGGATRVWALVSDGLVAKDGAPVGALGPVAVVVDEGRRAAALLEDHLGRIAGWWIVERDGHVAVRGEPFDWPRHDAFRQLRRAAEP
jgi:hypothetical protein